MRVIKEIDNIAPSTFGKIGRTYSPLMAASGSLSNDKVVIHQLVQEFTDISRKNIQSWRQGMEAAYSDTPRWSVLQDVFEYCSTDGHLGSQIEIRNGAIEANRYLVRSKSDGKEDPVKSKIIETEWFFNLIGYMCDSAYKQCSPFQLYIDKNEGIKYDEIPRRNFIPQLGMILRGVGDDKGFLINDPAFKGSIINMSHHSKYGILNDLIPDLIWKRNARQTWAEFSEKFGIPLISATTNSRDAKEIDRIDTMLKALGKAATAVLPVGTVIDIKSPDTKGDPYNIFLKQVEYCDGQMSKRINGGTMISDNGSSRSQSEVHERTLNYIIAEKERKRIEFFVNSKVFPLIGQMGLGIDPLKDEFVFDRSEDLSLSEHWEIVSKALELYDIDDQWVSEKFNFPITGRRQQAAPPTDPVPPKGGKKPAAGFFG